MTFSPSNQTQPGELIASCLATPANRAATPAASINAITRIAAVRRSALLLSFARELWSERIQAESGPMLPGLGGECGRNSNRLATLCCPSDLEPVALALSTNGRGCSCLPNVPTPTASDWKGSTGKGSRRGTLAERVAIEASGNGETYLPQPDFVEALMGFPEQWTALEDLATPSVRPLPNGSDAASSNP